MRGTARKDGPGKRADEPAGGTPGAGRLTPGKLLFQKSVSDGQLQNVVLDGPRGKACSFSRNSFHGMELLSRIAKARKVLLIHGYRELLLFRTVQPGQDAVSTMTMRATARSPRVVRGP
jgi:hypothetical protein